MERQRNNECEREIEIERDWKREILKEKEIHRDLPPN